MRTTRRPLVSFLYCVVLCCGSTEYALGQSLSWATQAGGVGIDGAEEVDVDSIGNTYVIGNFNVQATFGAGEVNETTLNSAGAVASQDIFVAKHDAAGALAWVRGIGGTDPTSGGNAGIDRGWGITVDGAGNSYVTGHLFRFTTFVDFGNGVTLTNLPGGGTFVAKYDTSGNAVWATHLEPGINPINSGGGDGFGIDVDGVGNTYVTGNVATAWKLDSNGNVLWERQATGDASQGHDISVDSGGNSYVTGRFGGTVTFGPGEPNETVLTAGNPTGEGFVAKYDMSGNLVWAKQSVSDTGSWGEAVGTDSSWNSYVTGPINGTTTFGSAPNQTTLVAQQVGDMFITKYDISGNLLWAKQVTGGNNEIPGGIAVDSLGCSYVTGEYGVTITFAPGEPNETTLFGADGHVFLAKYDTDGGLIWARVDGDQGGKGIAFDGVDGIHIAGFFPGSPTFGAGEPNETTLNSAGSSDAFVARYVDNSVANPLLDLDIAQFRATNRVDVSRGQSVDVIKLVVSNAGTVNGMADATVVGMQGGNQVYNETISVSDPVGNGRTTFFFPSFTPSVAGDITWTATIADQDPDLDERVDVTRVVP